MTSTQLIRENCIKWHKHFASLEKHLPAYTEALQQALSSKDSPNKETAFSECKKIKNIMMEDINALREHFPRLTTEQKQQLSILEKRFDENPERHRKILIVNNIPIGAHIIWGVISTRLRKNPKLIDSLIKMEKTGGEPDAIWYDEETKQYIFVDCSEESPPGRRNICYNSELQTTAEIKGGEWDKGPYGNVVDMAAEMGIDILSGDQYYDLVELGEVDRNSIVWLLTDEETLREGKANIGYCEEGLREACVERVPIPNFVSDYSFRGLLRV